MDVTDLEREHALAIKEAVLNDPELCTVHLTDFELVQHAIVAKDARDKALKRIRRLQRFK